MPVGFRADLTRRSSELRFITIEGREDTLKRCESIARDVADHFRNNKPTVGKLADFGLSAFEFYCPLNANMSEQLAEYVVAAAFYRYKNGSENLIYNTLRAIYTAPHGWQGADTTRVALAILSTLASIPDDYQKERIGYIMQCTRVLNTADNHPLGLITASIGFREMETSGSYDPNKILDAYERYTGFLKEMMNIQSVYDWMEDNRDAWAQMESDLFETAQHAGHGQSRGDYSGRRDNDEVGPHMDHNHQSDSDIATGFHESEDDDEESRYEDVPETNDVSKIKVSDAGHAAVNGVYERDGHCQGVEKYSRVCKDRDCKFSIFKCKVSNETFHWYISIVPRDREPGTVQDTDFYSASVAAECEILPPSTGWSKCSDGGDPPPTLAFERDGVGPTSVPF